MNSLDDSNFKYRRIIIFCGAPGDIQYTLELYEKYSELCEVSLFITNVKEIHDYIKSINIKLKRLVFIPYNKNLSLRKPWIWEKEKNRIRNLYNQYFKSIKNHNIYLFSNHHDWIIFFFLSKLYSNNYIHYIDYYRSGNYFIPSTSMIAGLKRLMYYYITKQRFRFDSKGGCGLHLAFEYEKFNVSKEKPFLIGGEIFEQYAYNPKTFTDSTMAVLIFESNEMNQHKDNRKYREVVIKVAKRIISMGYQIYLKPHPRRGYSSFLDDYTTNIIPGNIPGEFINYNQFHLIIGISSLVLARTASKHPI